MIHSQCFSMFTFIPVPSGYFLFFDASSPRKPSFKAEIVSPIFNTTGSCMRFKYNVNGDANGILKVVVKTSAGGETTLIELM